MNTFISSNTKPLFENIQPYDYLEPIKLLAENHKEIKPNYYRDILSGLNYDKLLKKKEILPQSEINDRIMLEYSKCFSDNNFITRILRGDTFDEIHKSRIKDPEINVCRKTYFSGYDKKIKGEDVAHIC